ncbi:MAG TPA: IMP cyclohydrolase [Spirochaetia bacterium]|nr:IMP cyclohydrolase [Spirochaetia bacterium]
MSDPIRTQYRTVVKDHFPERMEVRFSGPNGTQTLVYEKVLWNIGGEEQGLRYGENPGQEAALYKLTGGHLALGEIEYITPGNALASASQLLQSGKHPGKINITDVDSALGILKYLAADPCTVIVKHNNPSGVACAESLPRSFREAYLADRIAAFGGAVVMNKAVDKETAESIMREYFEVVAAPEFEEGVLDILSARKNLRVMRIKNMDRLGEFHAARFLDFKSLQDGGIIVQNSFKPEAIVKEKLLPARATHEGNEYAIARMPTEAEYRDLIFGWIVEAGVTSNSVLYVKNNVTIGIGTGEQDRVGVAEIARDKAYKKYAERIAYERYGKRTGDLTPDEHEEVDAAVRSNNGGLSGSVMVSDAFFPFRDAADVGIREGVTAIIQPGGAIRDYESIQACNEAGVTMVFTGERSFRH